METVSTFLQVLDKAETKFKKMQGQSRMTRQLYEAGNIAQAYEMAMKLEETSERMVLLTRVLPASTGAPHAAMDTANLMALCIPVEIGFTVEGWFGLRIPALLPKRTRAPLTISAPSFIPPCGIFSWEKSRCALQTVCWLTAMCMTEAARSEGCGTTIISRSIWFRILLPCM